MKLVALNSPPIDVQYCGDDDEIESLLKITAERWTKLGLEKPHWSVLSMSAFSPENLPDHFDAFYASGVDDANEIVAILNRVGVDIDSLSTVFEFGCGVGRVTPFLAKIFKRVLACDVSTSHLALAEEQLIKTKAKGVELVNANSMDFGMRENFDLWFSKIVLQHNSPPIISLILQRAFDLLNKGGVAIFQVPTYLTGYRFNIAEYLSTLESQPEIEMHVLPQPVVFALARAENCLPMEVLDDGLMEPTEHWRSTTFVFRKQ